MSKHVFGTYWAAQWHSRNRLDGDRRHLIHERTVVALFRTRIECRSYIEDKFGYIRTRPDLLGEPHGWRVPTAVKVVVLVAS